MDNSQNQNIPVEIPQQQTTSSNISWLKTLSIGFSLVSFCIAIGIGGYVLGTKKNQAVPQKQKVIPTTSQPSPTPDSTANWKMYTNKTYGYSFKYPADWIMMEENQIRTSFSNKKFDVAFELSNEPLGFVLDIYKPSPISEFDKQLFNAKKDSIITDEKSYVKTIKNYDLMIDGFRAVKSSQEDLPGAPRDGVYKTKYGIDHNGSNYSVQFWSTTKDALDKNKEIFDQILSTFQFINQK